MANKNTDFVEELNEETALALAERVSENIINGMANASCAMFSSFEPDTREGKAALLNATNDGEPLMDNCGKPIAIVDVVVMPVEVINDDESTTTCPRVSLLTAEGKVYTAVSWGVYKALQKIYAVYGTLHFADEPLVVEAKRVKTKKGQTINLFVHG